MCVEAKGHLSITKAGSRKRQETKTTAKEDMEMDTLKEEDHRLKKWN